MQTQNDKSTVRFNNTNYSANSLVMQASSYPQVKVLGKDVVLNPDGVHTDAAVRSPIVVQHCNKYYVLVVGKKDQAAAVPDEQTVVCRLATKYALKKASASVSYEDVVQPHVHYRNTPGQSRDEGFSQRRASSQHFSEPYNQRPRPADRSNERRDEAPRDPRSRSVGQR